MNEHGIVSKVKVMHITYDMRIGGTEMVIKNIIEGNKHPRCEMSIFCIEAPLGPWGEALQEAGVQTTVHARKPGFDLSLISALRAHIKQYHIDVLHCHQYTPWVYGVLASIGLKVKVIFTEHGRFYPDSSSWKRRFVNPILSMLTHKITAISHATKQALVDFEFLNANKIEVIYNGIEGLRTDSDKADSIKSSLNISPTDIVFGTIARLDPIKNHEMMLNAFAKALETAPHCTLVIVGDGDLMDTLQSQTKALKIEEKVKFTGYITYPKDYLATFDVFLLSSLSEGTSMTLLEAMSLSKPCVVTDAGGNKEIIAHEETGLVTDNNDMQQFADAMLRLCNHHEQVKQYGKQAKARFLKQFTVELMSAQYTACYGV